MKKLRKLFIFNLICLLLLSGCAQTNSSAQTEQTSIESQLNIEPESKELTQSELPDDTEVFNNGVATVYFFDVGQADCTLIISNRESMLIDTGDIETQDKVLQYLDNVGINKIDYLVLTHPHADHIGGAPDIIKNYDVENILMPNKTTTTKIFERVLDAISEKGNEITVPKQGDTYEIGDGTFTILTNQDIDWGDDLNYSSLILKVSFGDVDLIFTGDADKEIEENVLSSNADVSAEILKVGHHGSYTATCDNFLNTVNPEYAIILCGKGNSYGHPHDEIIQKLEQNNIKYYRSDLNGTIICSIYDGNIDFSTETNFDNLQETDASQETDLEITSETEVSSQIVESDVSVDEERVYILNTNTKKFHDENCRHADRISEENKEIYTGSYEDLINRGYVACKVCGG